MFVGKELTFDSYRLDIANARLWRGKREVRLTGKAFAVLHYLAEHAEQLVTKEELFRVVWPDAVVSDSALAVCVREIRRALKDEAKTPRVIKTVHRRGYRFLPAVITAPLVSSSQFSVFSTDKTGTKSSQPRTENWRLTTPPQQLAAHLVGREGELQRLHQWLEKARQGNRQLVFIAGDPGIGKTSLVEAFLQRLASGVQRQKSKDPLRPVRL